MSAAVSTDELPRGTSAVQEPVPEPQSHVIQLLEMMLADAKVGKVQAIVMAYADPKRVTYHSWAWDVQPSVTLLLGELERAKLYLLLKLCPPRDPKY